jgi:hypothetical protein
MSILKSNTLEDLVISKSKDAVAAAKSSLKNDVDDLVSDKDREDSDSHAQDAIDKAAMGGSGVHQESKKEEDDDPCWDDHEMVGMKKKNGKEVPNCVPKESSFNEEISHNKDVFYNKAEQEAFSHFMARKQTFDPMSGEPSLSDPSFLDMVYPLSNFKDLKNSLTSQAVMMGLSSNKEYLKQLGTFLKKSESMKSDSLEVLMWRTLTSSLQPSM